MKTPIPVGEGVPRRGNVLWQWLGACMLWAMGGWRIEGEVPAARKMVVAVAPHTSNWDFPIGLATVFILCVDAAFLGKHTLFRWPLGYFFRGVGGIPVDRSISRGVVQQTVDAFRSRSGLFLGIAPQGTRKPGTPWKMGFYHIAVDAQVPVLPVAFDYGRRVVNFGPLHHMTGQQDVEVPRLQAFFEGVRGRHGTGPNGTPDAGPGATQPGSADGGSTGTGKR